MSEYASFKPETSKDNEVPIKRLVGEARRVINERIPPGYSLFRRDMQLLNGNREPAFYSTREDLLAKPEAWDTSSDSIIAGFIWALQVPDFADHETADDDRTQEIGNMMSYALTCGLTEEQVLHCYKLAHESASSPTLH